MSAVSDKDEYPFSDSTFIGADGMVHIGGVIVAVVAMHALFASVVANQMSKMMLSPSIHKFGDESIYSGLSAEWAKLLVL